MRKKSILKIQKTRWTYKNEFSILILIYDGGGTPEEKETVSHHLTREETVGDTPENLEHETPS